MDENLYDEFGNYIGPELDDEDSDVEEEDFLGGLGPRDEEENPAGPGQDVEMEEEELVAERAIILHEDKKYYPDADEVYPEAETILQEEDTQPITEPIIAPVKVNDFDRVEKTMPKTSFDYNYLSGMMEHPDLIRNVCMVGAMHHGKTLLMDMLVRDTHELSFPVEKEVRYTDTRKDEQERGVSLKATPMSLVMQDTADKSYLCNVMDTPGHVNFQDEVTAAMRISDGVVIVVDVINGLMSHVEKMITHAVQEGLTVTLIVNSMDRLVLDLKLPPSDAYHKVRHVIEEVNTHLHAVLTANGKPTYRLSPVKGNVLFASGKFGFCFSTYSFANMYAETHNNAFDPAIFAKCLWGDIYFNEEKRGFEKKPPQQDVQRTFVQFILEPMYKILAHSVGEEMEDLTKTLEEVGVFLAKKDFRGETRALMKKICMQFFGPPTAFVDMLRDHIPSPRQSAADKIRQIYSGQQTDILAKQMKECDSEGHLMVHTVKCYHRPDLNSFDLFGRVMGGTLVKGTRVRVLGEGFSLDDDEDCAVKEVENLWIYQGRYRVEVSHVPAGNWVLIGGVDESITKTSTITDLNHDEEIEIFRPFKFATSSYLKVACEPLNPSELPKMVHGLRKIDKTYPLLQTKVEESGEHVVIGTGELYMDCALHDLRKLYGNLEIKIADPVVTFSETVVETSAMKAFAETPNKKNTLHMIAEPLEKGISEDVENGKVNIEWDNKKIGNFFTEKYEWDLLAARNIWAFGPDVQGPNVLLDDSLPTDVDKDLLNTCKDGIVQGFQWATREGPLCDEMIRAVKFKLLDADLSKDPVARGGGQIIPTSRRVCYSSFLLGTPRLMEPVLFAEIECPADCVASIYNVLSRRRGHVGKDLPKPGSPLFHVHAYIPAIESFGFETDLRIHTSGQAMVVSTFDHWSIVPGDPMDKTILLRPLEPAPAPHLAREFMLKTRRRKGLSEDVSIQKFFDDSMMVQLSKQNDDLNQYF